MVTGSISIIKTGSGNKEINLYLFAKFYFIWKTKRKQKQKKRCGPQKFEA